MIKKYKQRVKIIEAVQWTGDNFVDIKSFCGDWLVYKNANIGFIAENMLLISSGPFYGFTLQLGDYVLKNCGCISKCEKIDFESGYDEVNE